MPSVPLSGLSISQTLDWRAVTCIISVITIISMPHTVEVMTIAKPSSVPRIRSDHTRSTMDCFRKQDIHQGGLVQTQTGEWWTILFKDAGTIGRIPYLEPVVWKDGWPVLGNNGIDVSKGGKSYKKPNVGKEYPKHTCQPMMVSTPTSLGCSGNGTTILTIRHGL